MAGGKGTLLLVILGAAGVAGAWNFQRNLEAEKAEPRPFRGYSDAQLEELITVYRGEVDRYTRAHEQVTSQKVVIRHSAHMDTRIREFERVQRIGRGKSALVDELARRTVALEKLATEKSRRGGNPVKLFFKRLLSLPG